MTADQQYKREFLRQLLGQINRNLPNSIAGGVLATVFLSYFYVGKFPDKVVFSWAAFVIVVFLLRGLLGYLYQKKSLFTSTQYLNLLGINIILSGSGWAAVSLLFIDPADPVLMSVSVLALAGITAAALTTMTGLRWLSVVFIGQTLFPLAIIMWKAGGEEMPAMVTVIGLYTIIIISSAWQMASNTHDNIIRSIKFEERENQIRNIIDSSVYSVVTIDSDARIIDWNKTAESLFGWKRSEVLNFDLTEIFSAEASGGNIFNQIATRVREPGFSYEEFVTEVVTASANVLTVSLRVQMITNRDNRVFTLYFYDLTDQLRQEQALLEASRKSSDLLDSIHAGIVELDQNGNIRFMNRRSLQYLDYDENIIGENFHEWIQPARPVGGKFDKDSSPILNCLRKGDTVEVEFDSFIRSDGAFINVAYTCSPLYTDNRISGLVISFNDITEQYKDRMEQSRLLQITESSPEFIATFSLDGSILSVNKSMRSVLNISGEVDGSRNLREMIPADEYENLLNVAIPTAFMDKVWKGESKLIINDSKTITVSQIIMRHQASYDGTQYFSTIMADITDSKKAEAQLVAAKEQAEAAVKTKSEFLATMSHEIRTPMNGVLGMAELLLDTRLNNEQKEFVGNIESSGTALLTIINDILDFSKIEAGKMELEPIEFDLERSAYEVCSLLMPRAAQKNLELILDFDSNCPRRVIGDAGRLRQILMNLVGNAIKFTEQGHVVLQINAVENDQTVVGLNISVTDTGIGISADKHARLFESFTQADATTTRKYGGTGLGLSISQQLIEIMGSQIQVKSEPGRGSKFYFHIKLPLPDEQPELKQSSLEGRRVLIVDDNAINRQVLFRQLQHLGMQVSSAASHSQAIDIMRHASSQQQPVEIAILDNNMPELDGKQLGLKIMQDERITGCPLVIYTSSAIKGDARQFEQAGFRGYLVKPAFSDTLRETLEYVLGEFESSDRTPTLITRHAIRERQNNWDQYQFDQFSILLAEDNPINQKVAISLLEKAGFDVVVAANGQEAVDRFKERRFDAVLMDCQMPVKDGYEATAEIISYQRNQHHKTPIIALTANAMDSDREQCLNAGMVDFVPKPFSRDTLFKTLVNRIIDDDAISAKDMMKDTGETEVADVTEAIDVDTLNLLRENMGDDFDELVPVFIQSTHNIIESLEQAYQQKQLNDFVRHAHSLKSSSANLGGLQLSSIAAGLESLARSGSFPDSDSFLENLKSEFERVENELSVKAA